jgi:hypothetical protein
MRIPVSIPRVIFEINTELQVRLDAATSLHAVYGTDTAAEMLTLMYGADEASYLSSCLLGVSALVFVSSSLILNQLVFFSDGRGHALGGLLIHDTCRRRPSKWRGPPCDLSPMTMSFVYHAPTDTQLE